MIRLFGISALALYFEMVAIRYFPAYINLLAYFSNFVLLACFLGLGAGCLLSGRRFRLFPYFPWVLLALLLILRFTYIRIDVDSPIDVYFTWRGAPAGLTLLKGDASWLLPLCFIGLTLLFLPLGQEMGLAFAGHPPLKAYTVNIAGSLLGVLVFTLLSAFHIKPWFWFLAAFLLFFALLPKKLKPPLLIKKWQALLGAVFSIGLVWSLDSPQNFWSPYYRVTFFQNAIFVNGIPHQYARPDPEDYSIPYQTLTSKRKKPFGKVLILGSGTGNDVPFALKYSTREVNAIEIDPVIARIGLGRSDAPYADKRVRLSITDARSFLERNREEYDLIIFARIDSLTALTQFSTVRLESFVFTRESFEKVRERLSPDGLVVLFNYYRKPWVISRLYHTLKEVFPDVYLRRIPGEENTAILISGPGLKALNLFSPEKSPEFYEKVPPARDSWPFPYLHHPSLPAHYQAALALMFLFGVFMVRMCLGSWTKFGSPFFLMGAGFMLLETSAIVRMGLLFGSTWVVAAVAISCVLLAILLANGLAARLGGSALRWVYPFIFIFLALSGLPLKWFSGWEGGAWIFCAILFLSMSACGILFAVSFRRSRNASLDLGANLIGGLAGGLLEYSSLLWGYGALTLMAMALYLGTWFLKKR